MKSYHPIYSPLLEHLRHCGGCSGPRSTANCKYALRCAVAESLQKKGLVKNQKDLIRYSNHNSNHSPNAPNRTSSLAQVYNPEEGIGPCESEPG